MVNTSNMPKRCRNRCDDCDYRKHIIKILPEYFANVKSGRKRFELRKDDRNYQVGHIVQIAEYDGQSFTGDSIEVQISYILRDCPQYGLAEGWCIFCW